MEQDITHRHQFHLKQSVQNSYMQIWMNSTCISYGRDEYSGTRSFDLLSVMSPDNRVLHKILYYTVKHTYFTTTLAYKFDVLPFQVLGNNGVAILDLNGITEDESEDNYRVRDVVIHYLTRHDTIDFANSEITHPEWKESLTGNIT